jgi:hypothetical protein
MDNHVGRADQKYISAISRPLARIANRIAERNRSEAVDAEAVGRVAHAEHDGESYPPLSQIVVDQRSLTLDDGVRQQFVESLTRAIERLTVTGIDHFELPEWTRARGSQRIAFE